MIARDTPSTSTDPSDPVKRSDWTYQRKIVRRGAYWSYSFFSASKFRLLQDNEITQRLRIGVDTSYWDWCFEVTVHIWLWNPESRSWDEKVYLSNWCWIQLNNTAPRQPINIPTLKRLYWIIRILSFDCRPVISLVRETETNLAVLSTQSNYFNQPSRI
jgi:hypothetical protein